jgi:cyclic pyranopterin phosphate synthase
MRGFNDDEFYDFIEFVKERPIEVRFIEFMPFEENAFSKKKMIPYFEVREKI